MAFNGSGVFVRLYSWVTDAANAVFIDATRMDAEMNGFATGLSNCITKDGQTTPTAAIPMGGQKITGLANGTAATDAATFGQVWPVGSAVLAYSNAAQVGIGSAPTKVHFNAEKIDALNEFDSAINYRFTATVAGIYLVNTTVLILCNSGGQGTVMIVKNNVAYSSISMVDLASSGLPSALPCSAVVALAVSDYIEVFGQVASGTGNTIETGSHVSIVRVA